MEFIKKTIERILTTGPAVPCSYRDPETGVLITGCTATTRLLVPDKSPYLFYYFKFSLVQNAEDIGFFDAYITPPEPPPPPPPPGETFYYIDADEEVFTDSNGDSFVWE